MIAHTVLVRNRLATRSMLAMTRRPSATTSGRELKAPSSSTTSATAREAGLPEPIATPRSASLSARTSFTPSPVIATMWPRDCSAATMARFCWGVTRPNTVVPSSASASAPPASPAPASPAAPPEPGSGSVRASTGSPCTVTPARSATAATVTGLSPEMTLTSTPCSPK